MSYNLTSCGLVSVCNLFVNSGTSTDENVAGVYIQNNFPGTNGFGLVISRNGSGTTAALSLGSDNNNNGLISSNNTSLLFGKNQSGTFNEYMRINTSGNVGIGTTSPGARLQVTDTSNHQSTIFNARSDGGYLTFQEAGTTRAYLQWGLTVGGNAGGNYLLLTNDENGGNIALQTKTSGGTYNNSALVINSDGNVGIGTTSPDTRLHIRNCVNGGTNNYLLTLQNTCTVADARAGIAFLDNSNTVGSGGISGASIQVANNGVDGTGHLLFSTLLTGTTTERMRITCGGDVGIGSTAPLARLHVEQTTTGEVGRFRANTAGCADVVIVNNVQTWGFRVDNAASNALHIRNFQNNTNILTATTGGNVGIGTTTPSYKLHVNGTFYAAGSSIKYKEGICQYDTNSCLFMCLKPVTYQYKDEFKHLGKELKSETQIGLIAEDVADIMPELAVLVNEEDEKVVRNVDYEKLSIVLLTELQKLRKEVDELKTIK